MAVTVTKLTEGSDTDATSGTTASITPSANKLILLSVTTRVTGAAPNVPTVAGNGLTWVTVNNIQYDTTSSSYRNITVLRAMGASPSAGTVVISFAGQTQTDIDWTIEEFDGVDISGTNGSGAVVQSVTAKDETKSAGSLTVTLAAFSSTGNATFGAFGHGHETDESTAGTGFTKLGSAESGSGDCGVASEWRNDNDTTVDMTITSGVEFGGIAIEIKAAAAAGGAPRYYRPLMGVGN